MANRVRLQTTNAPNSISKLCVNGSCNNPVSRNVLLTRDECEDQVVAGDGKLLVVDHRTYEGPSGTYTVPSGAYAGSLIQDWIPDYLNTKAGSWGSPSIPSYSKPTNGALAAKLLAETNPSRSVVDIPTFFWELRELPSLMKKFGDSRIKNLADANLRYQFGLKPLLADLKSLLDFNKEVSDRYKELKALQEGGLRRKRKLNTFTENTSSTTGSFSSGFPSGSMGARIDLRHESEIFGFVKWFPTTNFPKTNDALRALAVKAVLGLTVDFSTAWNILPWSWLIDWFSSTGDFLEANRNIVPADHSVPLIMEHRTALWTFTHTSGGSGQNGIPASAIPKGPWTLKKETKSRVPSSASVSAHLPGLSLRQLSILGSIAIQRYRT